MQTTRAMVKNVKMAAKKAQYTKVNNAAIIQDNAKKTLTKKGKKTIRKKGETNKMPNISTVI